MISRDRLGSWAAAPARAVRPLIAALVTGTPDPPPPRSPFLRRPVPRALGVLPFKTIDLVLLADLVLTVILYTSGFAFLDGENSRHRPPLDAQAIYFMAAAYALPLALRQRWPLAAWRTLTLGIALSFPMAVEFLSPPYAPATAITYLLCVYSVAVRCDRDVAVGVWIVTFLGAWMIDPNSLFLVAVLVTVAVLFGYNVRIRRTAASRLVEEERRTERERAGRHVLAERARIARELHDVVAHHMSVIAIQAEAVPLRSRGDPGQLEAGLAEIRQMSLKALAEMRRVLGVLRDDGAGGDKVPQPGLETLEDLLDTSRAAGLNVSAYVTGSLADLPETVSLSAYRIVQESLSNAMRHSPGAGVTIKITRLPSELRLRAVNGPGRPEPTAAAPGAGGRDGGNGVAPAGEHAGSPDPARAASTGGAAGTGGGQGLVGMRERATMLGGTLEAGPAADGGFVVSATLPLPENR